MNTLLTQEHADHILMRIEFLKQILKPVEIRTFEGKVDDYVFDYNGPLFRVPHVKHLIEELLIKTTEHYLLVQYLKS